MVIWSEIRKRKYSDDDHWEDAPTLHEFTVYEFIFVLQPLSLLESVRAFKSFEISKMIKFISI